MIQIRLGETDAEEIHNNKFEEELLANDRVMARNNSKMTHQVKFYDVGGKQHKTAKK